eukprot:scaffold40008_cov50-Phaeocystis_antarctica.AAC.3
MASMFVTLDVSKLSGWLNADACCRVERRACDAGRGAGPGGGRVWGVRRQAACTGKGTPGAHMEHEAHVCDAGGFPARNVRVDVLHALEELAHIGDGRDAPVGDGAVRCNGGGRVSVVGLDRRLQGGLVYERAWAGPRTPARAVASRGKGR